MSRSGFGDDDDQESISILRLDLVGHDPRARWKVDLSIELAVKHFQLVDSHSALMRQLFFLSNAANQDPVLDRVVRQVDILNSYASELGFQHERDLVFENIDPGLPESAGGNRHLTRSQLHSQLREVVPDVPEPIMAFPTAHVWSLPGQTL